MRDQITVTLTFDQAVWLQTLVANAHVMPLDRRHRAINGATWQALVEGLDAPLEVKR